MSTPCRSSNDISTNYLPFSLQSKTSLLCVLMCTFLLFFLSRLSKKKKNIHLFAKGWIEKKQE